MQFSNIVGTFELADDGVVEKSRFKSVKEYERVEDDISPASARQFLEYFKGKFAQEFHERNLALTRDHVSSAVNDDMLIIQTVSAIDELDKIKSILLKRLREWYELYLPELSHAVEDQDNFVRRLQSERKILMKELGLVTTMGGDLKTGDVKHILELAQRTQDILKQREVYEKYLDGLTKKTCPNMREIAGSLLSAKLINHAGSLKRLAVFPASTVQILGAEKALFRHMKSKKHKPPKHGLIINHPLISKAPYALHGKVARALADKISIAAKVDYFKGKFIGDTLKKELEERFA